MATYNFKSAGKTQQQTADEDLAVTQIPYGIKTPLQLGDKDGILAMNYDLADQFADNLRNLLLTNWGERLGVYDFGANLKPITTEFVSQDDFDNAAIERIRTAVARWMPFIDLEEFSSVVDRKETRDQWLSVIKVNITYNIPALEVFGRGLQIVLYVI